MTAKIQAATRRAKRTELGALFSSGDCKVTSLGIPGKGKAGTVTEVTLDIAARVITEGTHRLATPEEIATYEAQMAQGRASHAGGRSAIDAARERFRLLTERR